jgi:VCBS repeat-containing protein
LFGNGGTGGVLQTNGTLSISDLDPGQSTFVAQTATAGNHGYGSFSINAAGAWTYAATNNQASIQSLTAGHTLTDSFTVTSFDGTATQDVTVTLVGVYG